MNSHIDTAELAEYERRVKIEDVRQCREDRRLTIAFYAVMAGFLLLGIFGLFSTPQIAGIG